MWQRSLTGKRKKRLNLPLAGIFTILKGQHIERPYNEYAIGTASRGRANKHCSYDIFRALHRLRDSFQHTDEAIESSSFVYVCISTFFRLTSGFNALQCLDASLPSVLLCSVKGLV